MKLGKPRGCGHHVEHARCQRICLPWKVMVGERPKPFGEPLGQSGCAALGPV